MTLVIELRRGGPPSRSGRSPGARPAAGTLERIVVDDEVWAAVEGLGLHRVPTVTLCSAERRWSGWWGNRNVRMSLARAAAWPGAALPGGRRPADRFSDDWAGSFGSCDY